jgi:predicted membrane-bound spermidine synthase
MRFAILGMTFACGACSLAVELAASQLLAPFFGDSINVWGVLIGMVLLYLSLGYVLGGRIADRRPWPWLFFLLQVLAGAWVVLVPILSGPLLGAALDAFQGRGGAVPSTFAAVIVLFAVPTVLFGCAPPFAIRLLLPRVESGGHTAGRVYALSTAGSILGALVPVFVTIPYLGTAQTLAGAGLLLVLLGAAGIGVSLAGSLTVRGRQRGTVRAR